MDLLFLINPHAGTLFPQRRFLNAVGQVCEDASLNYSFIDSLETCRVGEDTVLVICGGDGTVSSTVSSLIEKHMHVPIAIVPLGTGNDIARALGWFDIWDDWGPWGIITAIKASKCKGMDVWALKGGDSNHGPYPFVGYLGMGIDAAILSVYERLARGLRYVTLFKAQKKCYHVLAALIYLFLYPLSHRWRRSKLRLYTGAREIGVEGGSCGSTGCLLFSNIDSYLGGVRLIDSIGYDDGRLDLISWDSVLGFITFAMKGYFFSKAKPIYVLDHHGGGGRFYLEVEGTMPFQVDGEFIGQLSQGTYEITLYASQPVLTPPLNLLNPEDNLLKKRWQVAEKAQKALMPEPSFY